MSKFLAAIFVLGLSSFAGAQDLNAEKLDRLRFELLRCEQDRVEIPSGRIILEERLTINPVLLQDGDAELKARILEKVAAKLKADRAALMKRIEAIIDEELSKPAPAAKKPLPP